VGAPKRSLAENGTSKLVLRNDSRLYAYSRPAVQRRKKSLAARSRLKKIAGKIARHDREGGDRAA
jgi:hypothetical protein